MLYSTIYNTSNEMAYAMLREGDVDALPYLRKTVNCLRNYFLMNKAIVYNLIDKFSRKFSNIKGAFNKTRNYHVHY